MTEQYVIGVDVGTGSARAGVFDLKGRLIATAKQDIKMFTQQGEARYEQSSSDIWQSVCYSVRAAVEHAQVAPESIIGLSFDATCSLVALDQDGQPLAVGEHQDHDRNVIVWMDQRAVQQAHFINETKHSVLDYVGGTISPEMETPKLLWLKQNLPDTYHRAGYFFDLTDFLTWKATHSFARSVCTVVCKWTYLAHENKWDESYFRTIGLEELVEDNFNKIGFEVVTPGTSLGNGLSQQAASELGLPKGTPVAAGLIDAHAGAVGSIGAVNSEGCADPVASMAYVFGTSACTLTSSYEPKPVKGVWGPYFSAMLPEMWLNEAGQSAAGAAMDQLISMHPAYHSAQQRAEELGVSLTSLLSAQVKDQIQDLSDATQLVGPLIVVPEFLGNRAPFADPNAKAVIAGLTMDKSVDSLLSLYVAGICGIAYGLRQIIEAQNQSGLNIKRIVISGGAGQDPLIRQLIADATGIEVVGPESREPVMLGSAMLAALAANAFDSLPNAMASMSRFAEVYSPNFEVLSLHESKFRAFEKLQSVAREVAC